MLNINELSRMVSDARISAMDNKIKDVNASTRARIEEQINDDSRATVTTIITYLLENMEITIDPSSVSVLPGIAVATTGSAMAQKGTTTAEGQCYGTIKGSNGLIK